MCRQTWWVCSLAPFILAKLSLQWRTRKQAFVPANGLLYGTRIHSFSCKGLLWGSVLSAGALAKNKTFKNPCPYRASATASLHFWNLAIRLTASTFCIIVEILLELKLEFKHGWWTLVSKHGGWEKWPLGRRKPSVMTLTQKHLVIGRESQVLSHAECLLLVLFFILSAVEKAGGGEGSLGKNRKRSLLKLGNVRPRPAPLWKI